MTESFEELPPEVAQEWRLLHEEAKGRYKELAPSQSYVLASIIVVALLVVFFGTLAGNMLFGESVNATVTPDVVASQATASAIAIPEVQATETAHAQRCKERSAYQITFGNDGYPDLDPKPGTTLIDVLPPEVSATWVMTNTSQIGCAWEEVKVQPLSGGEVITPTLLLYPGKAPVQRVEAGEVVDLIITIPVTEARSISTWPMQWVLIVKDVPLFGDEEQYLTMKEPWIIP